jgi:hypothetical protein
MNKWPFYREKKLLDSWPLTPSLEKEKDARFFGYLFLSQKNSKLATDLVNSSATSTRSFKSCKHRHHKPTSHNMSPIIKNHVLEVFLTHLSMALAR